MSELAQPATGSIGHITPGFWARKLHSLSGVVPIGAFLVEHLWTNSESVYGPQAFNDAVEKLQAIPYLVLIEIMAIALPILYHSFYGIYITMQGRPNNLGYKYARNWMYFLQRVSGIILFFYIGYHVYTTRIAAMVSGQIMTYETFAHQIDSWPMISFQVIGLLSAVFHFANGLWAFLIGWGITTSEVAMRRSAFLCGGIGLALAFMGINGLLGFFGHGIGFHL